MGNYEEEIAAGKTRKLHYIYGGNGLTAIMEYKDGKENLYYTYSDYQGNLLAVANTSGKVVERYAYDPWGARRNPTNWTERDNRTSRLFSRGYTLHEHLDDFGLINMNGRVYDPLMAQFFSPDPHIQAPGNWFNYNRYAYCLNNPLRYSDPTGEKWEWKWLNPVHWLSKGMDFINDNTKGLRQKMTDAGVPDFGITVNSAGNTSHYVGNHYVDHSQLNNNHEGRVNEGIEKGMNIHSNSSKNIVSASLGGLGESGNLGYVDLGYNLFLDQYPNLHNGYRVFGDGLSLVSTGFTGYEVYKQYQKGGAQNVNPFRITEFGLGATVLTSKALSSIGFGGEISAIIGSSAINFAFLLELLNNGIIYTNQWMI